MASCKCALFVGTHRPGPSLWLQQPAEERPETWTISTKTVRDLLIYRLFPVWNCMCTEIFHFLMHLELDCLIRTAGLFLSPRCSWSFLCIHFMSMWIFWIAERGAGRWRSSFEALQWPQWCREEAVLRWAMLSRCLWWPCQRFWACLTPSNMLLVETFKSGHFFRPTVRSPSTTIGLLIRLSQPETQCVSCYWTRIDLWHLCYSTTNIGIII